MNRRRCTERMYYGKIVQRKKQSELQLKTGTDTFCNLVPVDYLSHVPFFFFGCITYNTLIICQINRWLYRDRDLNLRPADYINWMQVNKIALDATHIIFLFCFVFCFTQLTRCSLIFFLRRGDNMQGSKMLWLLLRVTVERLSTFSKDLWVSVVTELAYRNSHSMLIYLAIWL